MVNGRMAQGLVIDPAQRVRLLSAAPKQVVALVNKLAPKYDVQPELALAIIRAESNFDAAAVSPKNAQGLMQLIPATAERFNVRNPFDPEQNIRGGLAYLRWLLAYFEGDLQLVAAAYNAGEGTVDRYQGVPPFDETRAYVTKVLEAVGLTQHAFDPKAARPSMQLSLIRRPRVEAVTYRRGRE
jgi:soluble lytic murein transglycosylase-like protein